MPSDGISEGETAVVQPASRDTEPRHSDGAPSLPARIGRYEVQEEIGVGGMGRVLRAFDPALGREVALKLLRGTTADPTARARVLREAQAMAQVSHPHIVPIYDVGTHDGDPYIAMELVPGLTLSKWLRACEDRPASEILDAFVAAGRGLAAAHRAGLVHRDFKPSNVLVGEDGRVRVVDFGLARWTDQSGSSSGSDLESAGVAPLSSSGELTHAGTVMGTPWYMAPEQHTGGVIDARSDQYAFCVALWEGLFGERPFSGTASELLAAKQALEVTLPDRRDVPPHIGVALLRGLAPRPSDRFATMEALLGAITRDRPHRVRPIVVAGTLALGAMAVWGWNRHAQTQLHERCAAEAQTIEDVWDAEARAAVEASFRATKAPNADATLERLWPWLDRWTAAWSGAHQSACIAASQATIECLQERRAELEAYVATLLHADSRTVQDAIAEVAVLPSIEPCSDAGWLAHREPLPTGEARAQALRLRAELVEISTSRRLTPEARSTRFDELETTAREIGDLSLCARIGIARAELALDLGDPSRARELGEAAFELAAQGLADEVAARASQLLTVVTGMGLGDTDAGLRWGKTAQTYFERMGESDGPAAAGLYSDLGSIHARRGELDEALAWHARALAIKESSLGAEHPALATSLTGMAAVHHERGELAEAEALLTRVLTLRQNAFGEMHVGVAQVLSNLGLMDLTAGRFDRARDRSERSLAILEALLGPEHPNLAYALNNLAMISMAQEDASAAIAPFERALRLRMTALGRDNPDVAIVQSNLAFAYELVGRDDEALALQREALHTIEVAHGTDHSLAGLPLVGIAMIEEENGELEAAREHVGRAIELLQRDGGDRPMLGSALFLLARLTAAGGDQARAMALARRASDALAQVGAGAAVNRAEVDAWIAARE